MDRPQASSLMEATEEGTEEAYALSWPLDMAVDDSFSGLVVLIPPDGLRFRRRRRFTASASANRSAIIGIRLESCWIWVATCFAANAFP